MHCTGSATSVCRAPTASSSSPNPARSGSPIYSIAAFCNRPSRSTGRTIRRQSPFPFPQPSPATCCNLSQRSCPRFLIEGASCCCCSSYSWKQNWEAFLLVNRSHTGTFWPIASSVYATAHSGPNMSSLASSFSSCPAELVHSALPRPYLYAGRGMLTGHSKEPRRGLRRSPPISSSADPRLLSRRSLSGGLSSRSYDSVHITSRRNSHDRPSFSRFAANSPA